MSTAEKAGRFIFIMIGVMSVFLLMLPHIGISVDVVMSGSMEPTLKTGGIVFTDTRNCIPEAGDIVTYKRGESKVTHRIIRKEKQSYITKGDANNREDPIVVNADQIIGKVIFTLPFLGYAAIFVRQRTVLGIMIVMVFQEVIFWIMQWKGERIKMRSEKI